MAASLSTRQIEWTRGLFNELGFTADPQTIPGSKPPYPEDILELKELEPPWLLLIDNSSTVANLNSRKSSKDNHQNRRLFGYVRNAVNEMMQVKPWKINTLYNTADILTKLLPFSIHDGFTRPIASTLTFAKTGINPAHQMISAKKKPKV
jgi:hypothetical protein